MMKQIIKPTVSRQLGDLLGKSKWLSWKRPLDYLSVCQKFLKEHSVQFPNMCQLAEEQLIPGNSNPQGTRENGWT